MNYLLQDLKNQFEEFIRENVEEEIHTYWYDEIYKTIDKIDKLNQKYKDDYIKLEIDYLELQERFQENYVDIDELELYFFDNEFEL